MEESAAGPVCKFRDAHIYYALHVIQERGKISRGELSGILGIGEGSVRKIITMLKEWDLVDVHQTGISLTEGGRGFLEDTPMCLVDLPDPDPSGGSYRRGVLIRGVADQVTNGMEQRDSAVIAGATGASVFVVRDNVLTRITLFEDDSGCGEYTDSGLSITDRDVLVVTRAVSPCAATISAIASGLDTI